MNRKLIIGTRIIGENEKPIVIAEIGINHEGSLKTAFEMVDAAYEAGAEIVKHQTHVVDDEMSHLAKEVIPGNADVSIYEIMKRCSLSEEDEIKLKNYVEKKGMIFLSTPFSRAAADRLERMDVKAYKIGSGECNNYPLIEHVAKFGKPMIVSTGMNDIESVKKTVKILEKYNIQYALLHCTNIYPTPARLVRLGGMLQLKEEFPDAVIGLSDHTINNNACLAAVALRASIVERHFTDTKERTGPDIICSMDKNELKELINGSNEIYEMSNGNKDSISEEQVTKDFAFATVVSIKPVKKGEAFTMNNIWVKRPGVGEIKAEYFNDIIGKKSKNDLSIDQHISWRDVEE